MKKITCIIFLLIMNHFTLAENTAFSKNGIEIIMNEKIDKERWNLSIGIVKEFIEKLQSNTTFTQKDELYFFGETMESYLLLTNLKKIDHYVNFLNEPEQYSYVGEMIRLNRNHIIMPNGACSIYASGRDVFIPAVKDRSKPRNALKVIYDLDSTFYYVTIRWRYSESFLKQDKNDLIVTLKVFCTIPPDESNTRIVLDSIYTNGTSFTKILGYREKYNAKNRREPYLPIRISNDVQEHINKLEIKQKQLKK